MKVLQVAVGVIKNPAGDILISLRHPDLHQGGLWEFPGGKLEAGESVEQALRRELNEELGISAQCVEPLITIRHDYPDRRVQLHVCAVEHFTGDVKHSHNQPCVWVAPDNLQQYSFPEANKPIISAVQLTAYYAILDDADETALISHLEKILAQGVRLIQARLKRLSPEAVAQFVDVAYPLCQRYRALLLMNSDSMLANRITDGIHLTAQQLMGSKQRPAQYRYVAASCHNWVELQQAEKIGVDFVVIAPVLATQTHADAVPMGWDAFADLVTSAKMPVYALGGLSKSDLSSARKYGAQGIAAIRAFLD